MPTVAQGNAKHPNIFYFRVILSNIPQETPLAALTNPMVPNPDTHEHVKTLLNEHHVSIISYKMQIFKEQQLGKKFGHIDYFLAPVAPPTKDGEPEPVLSEQTLLDKGAPIVALFWSWVKEQASGALDIGVPGAKVTLIPGDSMEMMISSSNGTFAALPLLKALEESPIGSASTDPLKITSYLWSRIKFISSTKEGEGSHDDMTSGDLSKYLQLDLKDIPMIEYAFLRTHLPTIFPKEASSANLNQFFQEKLGSVCSIVPL